MRTADVLGFWVCTCCIIGCEACWANGLFCCGAWLSLVAVGVVEGTSGSEGIGHSVVYEDSSGFVGTVGSVEFQVSVGETGTFVGGTAYFGIQGNLVQNDTVTWR